MIARLFFAAMVLFVRPVSAQKGTLWPVKVGEIPNKVLPVEAMYALPVFTMGTAFLRDGTSSAQRFNYNLLQDEMQFINNEGDTLAVADPVLIKSVVIDTLVFYYEKFYVREVFSAGKYKLVARQQLVQIADKTRGGYDAASATSSIKTYGYIYNNSQIYQLQVKKDVLFLCKNSYYIISASNPFLKANHKNFHTLFQDVDITSFVKEHHTDFNQVEDLKALLKFCAAY